MPRAKLLFRCKQANILHKENNILKSTLNNIYELFPQVKELITFESFCRKIGFGTEMIRKMFNREEVGFKGEIFSHEHQRKFHTEHSIAKIEPDPNCTGKHRLSIDGMEVSDWFRQKQKQFLHSLGINIDQKSRQRKL